MAYEAIVIGASSGGMNAVKLLVKKLPLNFSIPVVIVLHISPQSNGQWISFFNADEQIKIKEADEKEKPEPGTIYVAPPNYHLLTEKDKTFSLTIDERVNFARPAIDVLFESAAEAYKDKLIGIVLTGSNNDGTAGMKKIKKNGGLTIVQDPSTAESAYMPASVINAIPVDYILPLEKIIDLLIQIAEN